MKSKTKAVILSALLLSFFIAPMAIQLAQGQGTEPPVTAGQEVPVPDPTASPVKDATQLNALIAKIIRWIQYIFFIVATIFVIIAAFDYLNSKGDPEKVKAAQNSLIYAAIAVVVALISGGLIGVVKSVVK